MLAGSYFRSGKYGDFARNFNEPPANLGYFLQFPLATAAIQIMAVKTLYICYFGVREPLVQTQVIPYLRELIKDGVQVSLLTFEPEFRKTWSADEIATEKARLAETGIDWHCLGYHKRPSAIATACDIFRGSFFVWGLLGREKFDILHGRVHIATLMGALARKFSRTKPKLLFDIRGFFPEEYTDAGIWPENGWLYRSAKRVEKWLLRESDGFVVLTEKAREILFPGRPSWVSIRLAVCDNTLLRRHLILGSRARPRAAKLGVEGRRYLSMWDLLAGGI